MGDFGREYDDGRSVARNDYHYGNNNDSLCSGSSTIYCTRYGVTMTEYGVV